MRARARLCPRLQVCYELLEVVCFGLKLVDLRASRVRPGANVDF
jgi:hypothetical protein